jgi:integrase/recombinase XerD
VTHCRQMMLEELQRRNFAPTTIATYLHAVEQFARHFKCRPDRLNQTHFRSYQAYLLREQKLRPLTVRLHVAALRFFFVKTLKRRYLLDDTPYPKAPRRLPQILSVEEVARVIDAADSLSHRTMLMVLYSTGMRNAELRHLQVADIDSRRMLIHIQRGKGGRDRYVPLSPTLLTTLRVYYRWMRPKTWLFPGTVDGWRADKPITSCAIRMPPTCSRVARTCARFSCYSVTWRSGTRCCISIFRRSICRPSRIRWMRSRSRGLTRRVGPV